MVEISNIKEVSKLISDIVKTDRWAFIVCTGEMGGGKSCLTYQLSKEISRFMGLPFDLNKNMTYSRKELKIMIDGDNEGKNQLEEYSVLLADELISMFFKRNWYDGAQIDGIELLNKCRDRHLSILGNNPEFTELDSSLLKIVSFWIHIPERGRAWLFQKDPSPFISDKWHIADNIKIFNKFKNPYACNGFVCEFYFDDFTLEEKEEYYSIRNIKRKNTEGQREKEERYSAIKEQRDKLIRLIFKERPDYLNKDIADILDISKEAVRLIREGLR